MTAEELVRFDWVRTPWGRRAHIDGPRRFQAHWGRETTSTLCGRVSTADCDAPIYGPHLLPCEHCVRLATAAA